MSILCSKCGTEVDSKYKFCPICGAELASAEEAKPAPVKKKSMPLWFKILLAITLIALIVVSAGLLFTETLVDVADKQLETLRKGEVEKAYQDYTSKSFRDATSLDEFKEFVNKYPILLQNQHVLFSQRAIKDHISILRGKLSTNDGLSTPIEYRLIKEDGKWKILSVRLLKVQSQDSKKRKELIQLAKNQLKSIAEGNLPEAYSQFTSEEFRKSTSEENFSAFIKRYPILTDRKLTSFHNPIIQGTSGRLSVILQSDQYAAYLKYYFVFENNEWKILSMRILSPSEIVEKQVFSNVDQPMDIGGIALGDQVDGEGLILDPSSVFSSDLKELYVNVSIQNGVKDTEFDLVLTHLDSGLSVSNQTKLDENGDILLTSTFTPPIKGWLSGHYKIQVKTADGTSQAVEFEIK